ASDLAYKARMCGRPPILSRSRSAYPMGKTGASGGPCCLNHSRAANARRSNSLCFAGVFWQSTQLMIMTSSILQAPHEHLHALQMGPKPNRKVKKSRAVEVRETSFHLSRQSCTCGGVVQA